MNLLKAVSNTCKLELQRRKRRKVHHKSSPIKFNVGRLFPFLISRWKRDSKVTVYNIVSLLLIPEECGWCLREGVSLDFTKIDVIDFHDHVGIKANSSLFWNDRQHNHGWFLAFICLLLVLRYCGEHHWQCLCLREALRMFHQWARSLLCRLLRDLQQSSCLLYV